MSIDASLILVQKVETSLHQLQEKKNQEKKEEKEIDSEDERRLQQGTKLKCVAKNIRLYHLQIK